VDGLEVLGNKRTSLGGGGGESLRTLKNVQDVVRLAWASTLLFHMHSALAYGPKTRPP
jgi:hypothetical protein